MKYAITGHRGLIGESLKRRLDSEGNKCVLHIDQQEGFNVMDLMFKETQLNDWVDTFYHFAAQCKINEAIARPILPHKNNVDGILSVLEFCRSHKIPKIVAASTSRILSPERNPYVASKMYVEELVKAYHDCYGLEYIIVRPSTVYGPMMDNTSRLINNFLTAALKNKPLKIYGDQNKTLDFTYVDDFVDGVMLATQNDWNKTYNISGEEEVNLYTLAKAIVKEVGSSSDIQFLAPEKAQPQRVKIDISELKAIGYDPKIKIKEGVKRMVEWYKSNPEALDKYEDKGKGFYNG